jgi:predicted ABC-type transport system involved in lysophospholipase L1 biosynthesis ATPase subunit
MLQELNDSGITIIVVTHDPKVAGRCRRVLEMRDGLIVEDA